jgi:conjugal transfer pilus assembly protein TraW
LLLLAAALQGAPVRAGHLGAIGPSYPVAEPNLLDDIKARLQEKERTGELKRLQEQARIRARAAVSNPEPVAGLTRAEVTRTFYCDPSFTLDHNVLDEQGHVMFPAGTRANPLDVVSMSKHLLFFDARDKGQVDRARQLIAYYHGKVKPILVGGSYLDLMKAWQVPVYYDQHGTLVQRLGIKAVPALVSQEGPRLRVDELEVR